MRDALDRAAEAAQARELLLFEAALPRRVQDARGVEDAAEGERVTPRLELGELYVERTQTQHGLVAERHELPERAPTERARDVTHDGLLRGAKLEGLVVKLRLREELLVRPELHGLFAHGVGLQA